MTIEETIIKPLQDSIDGTGQLMRFPMTQAVREVVRQVERKQDEIAHEVALQFQKAVVEDAIPFKEIEEELLALSPKLISIVWPILNEMLGGNDVWQKHFKSLRAKVRKREKEKDQPIVDNRQIIQIGDSPQYDENKE